MPEKILVLVQIKEFGIIEIVGYCSLSRREAAETWKKDIENGYVFEVNQLT